MLCVHNNNNTQCRFFLFAKKLSIIDFVAFGFIPHAFAARCACLCSTANVSKRPGAQTARKRKKKSVFPPFRPTRHTYTRACATSQPQPVMMAQPVMYQQQGQPGERARSRSSSGTHTFFCLTTDRIFSSPRTLCRVLCVCCASVCLPVFICVFASCPDSRLCVGSRDGTCFVCLFLRVCAKMKSLSFRRRRRSNNQ